MVARTAHRRCNCCLATWPSSARINPRDPNQKTEEGPSFLTPDSKMRSSCSLKTPRPMTVVVIGAGLSGLSAARTLQRSGQEVMVLEQASEIGGRVQTMDIDGYRVDKGFQVLLTAYQEAAEVWPEHEMDLFPFAAGAVIHGHEVKQVFDPLRHPNKVWRTVGSKLFTVRDIKSLLSLRLGLQGIH